MHKIASEQSPPESSSLQRFALGRFGWLLIAIVLLILFSGDAPDTEAGQGISILLFALLLIGTTFAARSGKKLLAATIALNVLFLSSWTVLLLHPRPATTLITLASLLACLLVAFISSLRFVLQEGRVTADHIMGAMCSYAMIAMIFATIYTMQWMISRDAFSGLGNRSSIHWNDLFYFSCTTLSTVGYGDIIPTSTRSRSVVIIEQMTGTFYVALLIARLANLYTRSPQNHEAETSSKRDD